MNPDPLLGSPGQDTSNCSGLSVTKSELKHLSGQNSRGIKVPGREERAVTSVSTEQEMIKRGDEGSRMERVGQT